MLEQIKQVAERIRDLREIGDTTAESLAVQLNLPLETYVSYESGEADIPISVLYNIANIFHVELGALLTGENPRLHVYAVVRNGKGASIDRRKEYHHESLASNFANKKAEPFLVTVEPAAKDAAVALNSHPGQEFNYVLNGTLKIVVDNHEVILNEGDSLFFDSSYEHGMQALNNAPAKFLAIIF